MTVPNNNTNATSATTRTIYALPPGQNIYFGAVLADGTQSPQIVRDLLQALLRWFVSIEGDSQSTLDSINGALKSDPAWPIILEAIWWIAQYVMVVNVCAAMFTVLTFVRRQIDIVAKMAFISREQKKLYPTSALQP